MLRHKPKLKYSGLTVILSNPSRFDTHRLLTATGGQLFNDFCLRPELNVMQCDIRLAEDKSPLLPETKCILLLGEYAMHQYCKDTKENTLNEMRGSPLTAIIDNQQLPAIASYFPQDAADFKNYEQTYNTESKEYSGEETNETEEDEGDVKAFSRTKRSNYAFWLRRDLWKCKQIISGHVTGTTNQPRYKIYPTAEEVINVLTKTKNQFLYFDIETDYEEQNLLCFSFRFGLDGIIFCVPVLNENYQWAYSSIHFILRALSIGISKNTLVAHNGHGFDFPVLGYKYGIPIVKTYDTMIAMHRCFPDIEKSLGHCTSYWTNERFHKDTDSQSYFTREHMNSKLLYCGKDVYTMSLIHKEITAYAKTIPGLSNSIQCGMDSIRPYVICSLQGIRYSQEKVDKIKQDNDKLMTQYLRILNLLIGPSAIAQCNSQIKSKKVSAFPSSNPKCCYYFHELLGYPVILRSKKTGKPSLGKKNMYKLALKFSENPVITFVLLYRTLQKEYSSLKFNPFRDDNNKITKPANTEEDTSEGDRFNLFKSISAKSY